MKGKPHTVHMSAAEIQGFVRDSVPPGKDMSWGDGFRLAKAVHTRIKQRNGWKTAPFMFFSQASAEKHEDGSFTFTNWYEA